MSMLNREVLENLIQDGFDLKLIAFELKVPLEKLEEYKRELEKYNLLKRNTSKQIDYSVVSREIQKMRRKYNSLYHDKKENEDYLSQLNFQINAKSEEDSQEAQMSLNKIRELLDSGTEVDASQKKNIAREIYAQYKNIRINKISFNQQIDLYKMLKHDLLYSFEKTALSNPMVKNFQAARSAVIKNISDTLEEKVKFAEDLEELEKLREIASIMNVEDNKIIVSTIKGNISAKIRKMQNEKVITELKNVPVSIAEITQSLVNQKINIEKAQKIIEVEAIKMVKTKKKDGFLGYTKEIAQKRISEQIHGLIRENAQDYSIGNVEELIENLTVLTKKDKETSVKTVITNMTNRKEFQRAKVVCEIYAGDDKNSETYKTFHNIKKGIERIEIGNIALNMINGGTPEEEIEWFNKIKSINKQGIKPEAVIVGKSMKNKEIKLSSLIDDEIDI